MDKIKKDTLWSDYLKYDWNYSIYLPEELKKGHKIIYFLHGAGGNHTDFYYKTRIEEYLDYYNEKSDQALVAVFVDGFNSYYIDKHLKIESAIIKELIPFIEKEYGLNVDRKNRYIIGLSLGGFGALNYGFRHSHLFSKVYLLSPFIPNEVREGLGMKRWTIFESQEEYRAHHPIKNFEKMDQPIEIISYTGIQDKIAEMGDIKYAMDIFRTRLDVKDYYLEGEHEWGLWDKVLEEIVKGI